MKLSRARGFTLIELMIALLVAAVLLSIGVPSFSTLIKNNRMLSLVYELRAVLNNARSEALAQRTTVTLCSSNDGTSCSGEWTDGYIAFRDSNANSVVDNSGDPGGDEIFIAKILDIADEKFTYVYSEDEVRFDARGYATGSFGTFTLCDDRGAPEARGIILTPAGIVRAAAVRDDTGVLLDGANAPLDCG